MVDDLMYLYDETFAHGVDYIALFRQSNIKKEKSMKREEWQEVRRQRWAFLLLVALSPLKVQNSASHMLRASDIRLVDPPPATSRF